MTEPLDHPTGDPSEPNRGRLPAVLAESLLHDLSREACLQQVLPILSQLVGGRSSGAVVQRDGNWQPESWLGPERPLPETLIGEAVDSGAIAVINCWCAAPLMGDAATTDSSSAPAEAAAIVIELPEDARLQSSDANALLRQPVHQLALTLHAIDQRTRRIRRIEQLSAVLQAAAQWQRLDDDESLLREIAGTATELLRCERASIFLWDRRRKKLIGRPALGIEGESLEVDDDAGVVGEVLKTAEPKIWNSDSDDEGRVNRSVDRSLDFETRSLVAVPMGGRRDGLIGVFEAINHLDRGFDAHDIAVLSDLAIHAAVAIESQRTRRSLAESRDRLVDDAASASPWIGDHPTIAKVRQRASKVAPTDLTVLVLGENGTGKEVLARHIHYESQRRSGPFIAVNCAALVESLLESELFGHEKGAFTDASQTRAGKFELAGGGTLFLDEVGDMSPSGQAKLLRVLEEKVVVRVGGSQTIPVDVRVIAATNQPLETLIAEKRFREDLFFRLNVVPLTLPPLRERGEDILRLADHFLQHFCYQIGRRVPALLDPAKAALLAHPWPGNVRELRNTIERVCYLSSDETISENDLMLSGSPGGGRQSAFQSPASAHSLNEATRQFQVHHIESAIDACSGNMTDAARRLGLHRSNLYRKMRQLGMQTSEHLDD